MVAVAVVEVADACKDSAVSRISDWLGGQSRRGSPASHEREIVFCPRFPLSPPLRLTGLSSLDSRKLV